MPCCVPAHAPGTWWRSPATLGLAAEGLALLFERAIDDEGVPDAERAHALRAEFPAAIAAQLTPRPPLADGIAAALAGATAMLDLSDGLAIDARRIADASGVAIDLVASAIGSPAALAGGEDHALLATFPAGAALPGGLPPDRRGARGRRAARRRPRRTASAAAGTPTTTGTAARAEISTALISGDSQYSAVSP